MSRTQKPTMERPRRRNSKEDNLIKLRVSIIQTHDGIKSMQFSESIHIGEEFGPASKIQGTPNDFAPHSGGLLVV